MESELFAWFLLGNKKKKKNQLTIPHPLNRSCLFLSSKIKKKNKKCIPKATFPETHQKVKVSMRQMVYL